jgi:hypothetical protein
MKSSKSPSAFFLFVLVGTVAVSACANGPDVGSTPNDDIPSHTTEPTEPPDDGASLPPSGGQDGGSSGDDAGTGDASTGADAGTCVTTPPSNACGLAPQCGCTAGRTCDVTNTLNGSVGCVAAGSGALASPCTETSQCAAGLACARGACRPYCAAPGTNCTGDGVGACAALRDSGGTSIPNANVCTLSCSLLNPSAACGSNTCFWDSTLGVNDCRRGGTKADKETCTKSEECMAGLGCMKDAVRGSVCSKWCRVGNPDDCGTLKMCVNVYGSSAPMESGEKLGLCQ